MTDGRDRALELSSLRSVTRGASLHIAGKLVVNSFGFLLQLLISRHFGAVLYGVFAYGRTVSSSAMTITNVGSDKSLLRYIPERENKPDQQSYFLGLAWLTSAGGAFAIGTGVYLTAPIVSQYSLSDPTLVRILRIFAFIIIFDTLTRLIYATFRSLEKFEYTVLTSQIIRPITRLGAVAAAIGLGLSLYGTVIALAAASLVIFILGLIIYLKKSDLRPSLSLQQNKRRETIEYYNYSLPLSAKEFGQVLQSRVDILMVGIFLSSTSVGIYNASLLVAGVLTIPTSGLNQLFPPVASRLYSNQKLEELNSVFSTVTRWAFTISFIMAVTAIVYRKQVLQLFGPQFTQGSIVLALFMIGGVLKSIGGPSSYLLMMTGHQYAVMLNHWIFGLLNIVMNYILIQQFGLIGAVLASAGLTALLNIVRTIEIWHFEQLFPYSKKMIKPIVAGAVSVSGMVVLSGYLSGLLLLFLGGAGGVCLYILLLISLGIENEDRDLFEKIVS